MQLALPKREPRGESGAVDAAGLFSAPFDMLVSESSSFLGEITMKIVRIALVALVAAAGLSVAGCAKAPAPAPAVVKG